MDNNEYKCDDTMSNWSSVEEDWENWDIIEKKITEEQLKRLEEQKAIEDSDLELSKQLFDETFELLNKQNELCMKNNKCCLNRKPLNLKIQEKHEIHIEQQKLKSKKLKQIKQEKQRQEEVYGSSEADIYDETYGYMEDEYR